MFGIKKEELIKNLTRLSVKLCAYCGSTPCDCKYMNDETQHIASGSESGSGCPETHMAAELLSTMTTQEFFALAKRANIAISDNNDYNVIKVSEIRSAFAKERQDKISAVAREYAVEQATKKAMRATKKISKKNNV